MNPACRCPQESLIQKENNILYPMAQNAIPPEELDRLDQSCEAFDLEVRGGLDADALKELGADLVRRYPAEPADLTVFEGHGGCHAAA